MPRTVLIAAHVAWPTGILVLRLITRVRRRCLAAAGVGWLAAVVVATTAPPTSRALPVGLVLGAGIAIGGCFATARGVTFTWEQQQTYWAYDGKIPPGDRLVEVLTGLVGLIGVIALA